MLGTAPAALAAPPVTPATAPDAADDTAPDTADDTAPDAADDTAAEGTAPAVHPRPQSLRHRGADVAVPDTATLVAGPGADPCALDALRAILRGAGVTTLHEDAAEPRGLVVYAGGAQAGSALRALGAHPPGTCPPAATGSPWAVRRPRRVALDGAGDDGLFHAAQTLRQLIVRKAGGAVPGVVVRDWPRHGRTRPDRGLLRRSRGPAAAARPARLHGPHQAEPLPVRARRRPVPPDPWREPYPAAQRADFRSWPSAPGPTM